MAAALVAAGSAFGIASGPGVAAAAVRCQLDGRAWLEGRLIDPTHPGAGATARAVDAVIGTSIEVLIIAPGRLDGRAVVFADDGAPGRVSWRAAGCPAARVRWRRVEPRMEHVATPSPNRDIKVYANAVVFGPRHGSWIGFDRLEYTESDLVETDAWRLVVRDARPSEATGTPARDPALRDLGTMRLAATVTAASTTGSPTASPTAGPTATTPGAADAPDGQVSDRVFRYSFRSRDGLVGWMTAWFNVPYVFGSAGKGRRNQADRFVGADCADLIVAAMRRAGRPDLEYSSVGGLVGSLARVAGPVEVRPRCAGETPPPGCGEPSGEAGPAGPASQPGQSGSVAHIGDGAGQVRPGDVLAIDYIDSEALPRAWDHILVLVEDRGPGGRPDGVLGPEDITADTGDAVGLKLAPLGEQGAIRVVALRARGVAP